MNLETRVRELATLNTLGDILNREADFAAALGPALDKLVDLVDLSAGWVFMTNVEKGDSHQGSFHLAAFTGLPPALNQNDQRALCKGGCECQSMFSRGELDQGVNMVTCSRLCEASGNKEGLEIHASIPLLAQTGPVGIINLAAPGSKSFDAETLTFLTTVGRQLGTAFERSRLQAERTREARHLATLEERHRLAQTMHDSVAQLLFAADLSLRIAQESDNEAESRRALDRTGDLVQDALAELRGLVEVMRPADLTFGLKAALVRLAQRTGGTVDVHLEAEDLDLSPTQAEALYYIAQEALHNTLRHTEARHVWLKLRRSLSGAQLQVRDDGAGFDPAHTPTGLGLSSMSERARSVGGEFTLRSSPVGTRIEVRLT